MKKLQLGLVALVMMQLVGCASVGQNVSKQLSNVKQDGFVYGAYIGTVGIDNVCKSAQESEVKCQNKSKYKEAEVLSKMGFSSGSFGVVSLADSSMDIGQPCTSGSSSCTYLKVKVTKGQLGEVVEVASRPGDGKCHWAGMPRAGGVVCPAYNWDYEKDNQSAVNF